MTTKKQQISAKIALFAAALIWGTSFVVMKNSVDIFPTPVLLGIRFTLGCLLLCILFRKRLKNIDKGHIKSGFIIGTALFFAYYIQTIGLTETSPGKNAILTAVYCVIVPFLMWGLTKRKPDIYQIIAAILCMIGIGMVSLNESFSLSFGDSFTLIGAFLFALHIACIACFARGRDPVLLTILQFGTAALYAWIFSLFTAEFPKSVPISAVFEILYLAFFATAGALLLQNYGQKYADAASASILLCLESVFGMLFSLLCGAETLTFKIAVGFCLIFFSVVLSETKLSFLKKKKVRSYDK